ncbi:hypothetical protein HanIR_Chr02g0074391 [Helianthus annuus]|nr:hypothetical protein HanIR_Chr02g0074391 [Helianthus annuus]
MGRFEEASDASRVKTDDADSREAILPGVNLLFDRSELRPFDIGACLLARQPVSLIVKASLASSGLKQEPDAKVYIQSFFCILIWINLFLCFLLRCCSLFRYVLTRKRFLSNL